MKSNNRIGKLRTVPVREAFPHEAHDFTVWLADNIDALSMALDLELFNVSRELPVGDFSADLFCYDAQGNGVVIENQLKRTDHDHFGKLMTYWGNLEAHTAIWITPEPREEHRNAVERLNALNKMSIYLVKLQVVQIADSPFAPLFTVIVRPLGQTPVVMETESEHVASEMVIEVEPPTGALPRVWCFYPRRDQEAYDLFLNKKIVGVGFGDAIGDFREIPPTPEAYRDAWMRYSPLSSPRQANTFYAMFYSFVNRINVDDLVIYAPTWKERIIYVGKISGAYEYATGWFKSYRHRRSVKWITQFPRDSFSSLALKGITVTLAVFKIGSEAFLSELEQKLKEEKVL